MSLQMLGMNVLVQENQREETTASGLVIPRTVNLDKSGLVKAKVVSVGPGEWQSGVFVKPEIERGDEILLDKNFSKPLKDGDLEFAILSYRDVLGVIK